MERRISELRNKVGTNRQLNAVTRQRAELEADTSEMRSRIDIVEQDTERLRKLKESKPKSIKVEFKRIGKETRSLRDQL